MDVTEILIRATITLGVEVATAIYKAVKAGDVNTVQELAKTLPDEHQLALSDEALIRSQTAKAHAADVSG